MEPEPDRRGMSRDVQEGNRGQLPGLDHAHPRIGCADRQCDVDLAQASSQAGLAQIVTKLKQETATHVRGLADGSDPIGHGPIVEIARYRALTGC